MKKKALSDCTGDLISYDRVCPDLPAALRETLNRCTVCRIIDSSNLVIEGGGSSSGLIGESPSIKRLISDIELVSKSSATVLIRGESGTGKEVVARELHAHGNSPDEPFVAINCGSMHENLLESELFGHAKGAYTGAANNREGLLESAGKGTVLLDEIGEMPMGLQSKILRVLEQKEFYPLGEAKARKLNARILLATNRNLEEAIDAGDFREDLYYRINVIPIKIPPLRERICDIMPTALHFVKEFNVEHNRECKGIDPDAVKLLLQYLWPGNIRQLRNVIERAMIMHPGEWIECNALPAQIMPEVENNESLGSASLKEAVRMFERAYISRMLASVKGCEKEASRRLGIDPSTLYRKMKESKPKG